MVNLTLLARRFCEVGDVFATANSAAYQALELGSNNIVIFAMWRGVDMETLFANGREFVPFLLDPARNVAPDVIDVRRIRGMEGGGLRHLVRPGRPRFSL